MEEINGCLGLWESITDYLLSWEQAEWLPELYEQDKKIFEYNQGGSSDCTLYSAFGAVSDLFNYQWTSKEINEMIDESYKRGRIKGNWRYVKSAVNLVADYWNAHHSNLWKVVYYRISLYDTELVDKILTKNYTLCSGYKWNSKYNKDRDDNAVLNGTSFWSSTYGHAVSWIGRNGNRYIKDNYKGRISWKLATNIYRVEHTPKELVSGGCYYQDAYLYTKVIDLEDIKRLNQIKTECNNCITSLWAIWHLVKDTNFQSVLHYTADKLRWKIKDCDNELAKYK